MLLISILLFSFSISQNYCPTDNSFNNRSIYNVGDTLSIEDQDIIFPVCNGSGEYETGDSFSFSDLNGNTNNGEYKISIISMNATW